MATFNELIKQVNDHIKGTRDRGTAFEEIVVAYLKNEPTYHNKFSHVWMLNEVPDELGIPKKDTGVDIVAQDRITGGLTAVQAKFYTGKVGKDTINSFIAEFSKNYYEAGILVSTTDQWNRNAEQALEKLSKPMTRIGLSQLEHASINWQLFDFDQPNDHLRQKPKELRDYQQEAIDKSLSYFKQHDRGKLIMAPGTGKTFTSLKIAEALMKDQDKSNFNVLYLVPSIQLLSQTLFNWNDDHDEQIYMNSFSVVSDAKATKKKHGDDDLSAKDIGFPATTNVNQLMDNYQKIKSNTGKQMNVIFSTYQSIDVIHKAQEIGLPEFDLIVADEAHRTTGANEMGDPSVFTKVHSNKNVSSKLRLYQTATPKVYGVDAKKKAKEQSVVISSMDDEKTYGDVIFHLGFGDAVNRGYLTDYKVSVLAVSEQYVNKAMQETLASDNELKTDDPGKIIGVWNAMVKRNGLNGEIKGAPMKRAIAFTDTIAHSKEIAKEFNNVVNDYLGKEADDSFTVDVKHVDGSLNALQKKNALDWLANDMEDNHARVLSNVRFLTEGIDVPSLDAVIFFSPKKSQVDIVQAVGRIMRRYEGKDYGYIILPVVIDAGAKPEDVLDNNKRYREVWQVLNALRSTDERFEAEINKLQLNKKKSGKINFIGTDTSPSKPVTEERGKEAESVQEEPATYQTSLALKWGEIEQAFYGRVVQKVGDRRYLEDWSSDVANIAHKHIQRINDLIDSNVEAKQAFDSFLKSLHYNINDGIDRDQAVQMLAQHLITQPVFEALFAGYSFVKDNPVSQAINSVVAVFEKYGFDNGQQSLKPFYDSVKARAQGIDNAAAKQRIIKTLYENFFRKGFEKTTDAMGIVFTPVEVVDFIIHSVDDALQKYFGKRLSDQNVHVLDPFTGTGTFITRTLQYFKQEMDAGKITYQDILRKYMHELHAKDNSDNHELFYHDIGNYLSRKEKLELIQSFGSITNIPWKKLLPDINSDWINPRDPNYQKFPSISGEAKSPFYENAPGINTNRDGWAVSFSKHNLYTNMERMIANYNQSLDEKKDDKNVDNVKWSAGLRRTYRKGEKITFNPNHIVLSLYRPFAKKWLYFDRKLTERPGKYIKQWGNHNIVILTSGRGSSRFSSLVSGLIPNLNCLTATQGFMMYNNTESSNELIKQNKDNITTYFSKKIGLTKDDTFAYIYGLLNSKEYRDKYANDLKKDLARIPVVKDKDKYVEIGKKLIDLHLNYEKVEPYDDVNITVKGEPNYRVKKMKFAKKLNSDTGKREKDYSTIIFNDTITISNIPLKAYSYIIDDKSAIEWIMDQYQVKTDKKSGITDDPNDYSDDQKYIFNLLLRIINVSIQTVDLVNKLPDLTID
ncbi:DEAD/DEAH box helicase family protein [Limosilactobacillus reuteri]|uniref:type ISP restriction/modification enzyme n=1 Tax=Limosilactobacillus reuteri TaxID=1598 RepID=UPI001E389DAF|nr:type ISP restriction/modification enzyme [Limosilactobacillus reuteri]MCC4352493.1 DEAD/DEAH box helicase family protein [Limosilactobacillus reuteri]MCC4376809.1 DEAD/DEAH box helicase family protein [Limosilactobacillus reuteri]